MSARAKLQALLAAFDDAAYEALASRGLLRRARKDLSRVTPEIVRDDDDLVLLRVDDAEVQLPPNGPARARCSCPSPRCCRHVLAACLYLAAQPADSADDSANDDDDHGSAAADSLARAQPNAATPSLAREITALDDDAISAALGRKALEQGRALLAEHDARVELEGDAAARVVFDDLFREVRYFAGAGLDGMVPPAADGDGKRLHVAALLRLREQLGPEAQSATASGHGTPPRAAAGIAAPAGAPRDRAEVVAASATLLCSVVRTGLTHASRSAEQRLTTLAVSCLGVRLPRLARALEITARELRALRRREAQASERRLFDQLARTLALCRALEATRDGDSPWPASLVGRARRRYVAVPRLDLVGLGASSWRTKSGYEGLTVYLYETSHGRVLSWVDARPVDIGWTAAERYRQPGPYPGLDGGPLRLCRSRLTLFNARVAPGRLSGTASSHALVHGPADPTALALGARCLRDFASLARLGAQVAPSGLADRQPHAELMLVEPAAFGRCTFDRVEQRLDWSLRDAEDRELPIRVDFEPHRERAIKQLEAIAASDALLARVRLLLGRLVVRVRSSADRSPHAELALEPLALWLEAPELRELGLTLRLFNLGLDELDQLHEAPALGGPQDARGELARASDGAGGGDSATEATPGGDTTAEDIEADDIEADDIEADGIDDDDTALESATDSAAERVSVDARLAIFEDLLERLAERGLPARGLSGEATRELERGASALGGAGFGRLARAARAIASAGSRLPDRLLAARYLCQLHRQATLWRQAAEADIAKHG